MQVHPRVGKAVQCLAEAEELIMSHSEFLRWYDIYHAGELSVALEVRLRYVKHRERHAERAQKSRHSLDRRGPTLEEVCINNPLCLSFNSCKTKRALGCRMEGLAAFSAKTNLPLMTLAPFGTSELSAELRTPLL